MKWENKIIMTCYSVYVCSNCGAEIQVKHNEKLPCYCKNCESECEEQSAEMTDKEIIKDIEYYVESAYESGVAKLSFDEINNYYKLINRQQAEIERLKNYFETVAEEVQDKMTYMCGCKNCIETVRRIIKDDNEPFDNQCNNCNRCKDRKTEAIKEFADRLKEHLKGNGGLFCVTTMNAKIDNLVKETAGADNV